MTPRRLAVLVAGAVLGGALIADAAVAVVAGAVVLAAALARVRVSSFTAIAAAVSVAAAGFSTIFEAELDPDNVNSAFADLRPVAAQFGALAAVLVFATAAAAVLERTGAVPAASEPRSVPPAPRWLRDRLAVPSDMAVLAVGALLVRLVGAPDPLSGVQQSLADNLDAGIGVLLGAPGNTEPTNYLMPLPALVEAFFPLPATVTLALVGVATVLVVFAVVERLAGRPTAILAGWIAALTPALWGQQLPEALGALGVAGVIWFGHPSTLTRAKAFAAGGCIVVAVFARPEALLLLPLVGLWWVLEGPSTAKRVLPVVAIVLLALAPWSVWTHGRTGTWMPTTSLGPTLAAGSGPGADGAASPALDPGPDPEEAAADRAARTAVRDRLADHLDPELIGRRVLRGWDLWSPSAAADSRSDRGLPLPGGPVGSLVEVAVLGLAVVGAWTWRHRWRVALPVFALPVLFTLETAVVFGDRGLRGWVMPAVVVLAAVGLAAARQRIERRTQPASSAS